MELNIRINHSPIIILSRYRSTLSSVNSAGVSQIVDLRASGSLAKTWPNFRWVQFSMFDGGRTERDCVAQAVGDVFLG